MKRIATLAGAVMAVLLCAVVLAGPAAPKDADASSPPCPAASAAETASVLAGPAGWHYRHSQPTSWRACTLRQ
jgi:hypothetical protein